MAITPECRGEVSNRGDRCHKCEHPVKRGFMGRAERADCERQSPSHRPGARISRLGGLASDDSLGVGYELPVPEVAAPVIAAVDLLHHRLREAGLWRGPTESITGAEFEAVGLPMLVACTGCGMTMSLPSALLDPHDRVWCPACLGVGRGEGVAESLAARAGAAGCERPHQATSTRPSALRCWRDIEMVARQTERQGID